MNDINRPTTLAEITQVMGKNKSTFMRRANKENWKYSEQPAAGKPLRLYDLKDLPKDVYLAVFTARFNETITPFEDTIDDRTSEQTRLPGDGRRTIGGGSRKRGDLPKQVSDSVSSGSVTGSIGTGQQWDLGASDVYAVGGDFASGSAAPGRGTVARNGASTGLGESGIYHHEEGVLGTDPQGSVNSPISSGELTRTDSGDGLADYTDSQKNSNLAISNIMRFIDAYSGTKTAAIRYLNSGYQAGTLPSNLVWALENAQLKKSGVNKSGAILPKDTVPKWRTRFKEQGNYMPGVRQKDMTLKPWHVDLVAMLENNPQNKPTTWMIEQIQAKYGKEVSEHMVYRYVKDFSQGDVIKGENSGMQLRAKQAYQPRTSAGLEPWQEMHADGWTTHFTAPHPITGEFVTYEIWDFHDVATRYVPPFGIGLTECFEVIAKGVENAIRDNGVMCILQTDSTKIVKDNDRFIGDPVKSISDKAGFTIVHPQTVGNAQANGIAENFHTWMDKEARELATYQAKNMDSLTLRRVKKITAAMVKAANHDEMALYEKLKAQAAKAGGGLVLCSYEALRDWLESKRCKWNNKPHRSLKKIRDGVTGKLRHQTPQEALDEFKAQGWKPWLLHDAILADLFLVHKPVTVRRGMVKPYGGMLFRNPELDTGKARRSSWLTTVWITTRFG